MRVYLVMATGERGVRIPPPVLDAARRAVREAFPVPAEEISGTEWLAPDAGVALLAWSNEPSLDALPEALRATETGAMGYCGYLADRADEDVLLRADPLGPALDRIGGCFSVFRAGPEGFEAATPINRVCPVYHAESAGLRIAGSRAILVHLTARAAATGMLRPEPDYDVLGLHVMVRHGFFTSDKTPFNGVFALPNSASLTAKIGSAPRVDRRPLPEQEPMPRSRAEARERVAPLAEALLESVRPFERHDLPVRVALSGGRDSRVLAAALHGGGIPFVAATHGLPGSPDVLAAAMVAQALGTEQQVQPPSRDERGRVVVVHPVQRAHHVVRMCEGMVSAYENVTDHAPYDPQPRTSGSGGERLRGGFLSDQEDVSPDGIRRRLKTIFCAQDHLLAPEAKALARERYEHWCERAADQGMDVLDKLHMFYRTGRWLPGSHTATLMNWPYYHPYLDARVTRQAVRMPIEWRYTEEPMFLAMDALAPAAGRHPARGPALALRPAPAARHPRLGGVAPPQAPGTGHRVGRRVQLAARLRRELRLDTARPDPVRAARAVRGRRPYGGEGDALPAAAPPAEPGVEPAHRRGAAVGCLAGGPAGRTARRAHPGTVTGSVRRHYMRPPVTPARGRPGPAALSTDDQGAFTSRSPSNGRVVRR